ncbi:MAG: YhcH/YjgK/YiaL family protein [Treponema sp.]|jgi:YhcH/YjgK/YiaL family protein|nr:YhcH/YjgK/YiaL family protein [Treponema sp.]
MILDRIENSKLYAGLGSDFKEAFEFIAASHFEKAAPGRYVLKGDMYYTLQIYETRPEAEAFFEAHRAYIDLQYVVSGRERHDYANISALTIRDAYNAEKDLVVYDGKGCGFVVNQGFFAVYFPEDAHMPNLRIDGNPEKMVKVVVKIPVG